MKPDKMKAADTAELVAAYRGAAAAHGAATSKGDHKIANKQYEVIAAAYRELRSRGIEAQRALLALLDDAEIGVRSWAGAHALEFSSEDGERVLSSLASDGGFVAMNAQMTLKSWREGTLKFP